MSIKRTMKWHKVLKLKELRHVFEHCGGTLAGIKKQVRFQWREDQIREFGSVCWDCRTIANKLGLWKRPEVTGDRG